MKTAVVILNWNGRTLLEEYLPSVVQHATADARVYIIDNASTDGSIAYLQEHFPEVTIIQNTRNEGYAKGYNQGLKHIDADLYVLLNSDVEVTQNWLTPVVEFFEQNRHYAAAQPKILDYKNKDYFEYAGAAGGFIDQFGYPYCRGRIFNSLEKDEGQYDDIAEIFWASGACLFIRRDTFWEAGGFDEDYFAHQEEIDLCWRLFNLNYKVACVGSSKVYHLGGATLNSQSPKKTFLNFRNSLYNILKNTPKGTVFKTIFIRMLLDGLAGIQFLATFKVLHFTAILKAHGSFYAHFFKLLKKRPKTQKKQQYYYHKSIVFLYFVRQIKLFNKL